MHILSKSQIKSIVKIALEAGKIAMSHFGKDNLNIIKKSDNSPLTIADSLISKLILQGLQKIIPSIPVICEEGENRDFGNGIFWLIDPIDGTISFTKHDPEFTINIALIKNKKPIFGLIFAPAIDKLPFYYTDESGAVIKYDTSICSGKPMFLPSQKKDDRQVPKIVSSKRSSDQDILNYFNSTKQIKLPTKKNILKVSSSLKFLYLIEKKADLYLHLRRSMEWDIAAGHALLEASGGRIINLDGSEFLYAKADLSNKPFLASL